MSEGQTHPRARLISPTATSWLEEVIDRRADCRAKALKRDLAPPALKSPRAREFAGALVSVLELAQPRYGTWVPRGHYLHLVTNNAMPAAQITPEEFRDLIGEQDFLDLASLVEEARDFQHYGLLNEISATLGDGHGYEESVREQLIEQLTEFHDERRADEMKSASDALYYWLMSIGHQWAIEHERVPDSNQHSFDELRIVGLAADLGLNEQLPEVFLDMLSVIDQAIGPDDLEATDREWRAFILDRVQATFWDDDELLGYLKGTDFLDDSALVTGPLSLTEAECARMLMAERWAARRKPGVFPWGEPAVCPITDPLKPGSVSQLPPISR